MSQRDSLMRFSGLAGLGGRIFYFLACVTLSAALRLRSFPQGLLVPVEYPCSSWCSTFVNFLDPIGPADFPRSQARHLRDVISTMFGEVLAAGPRSLGDLEVA